MKPAAHTTACAGCGISFHYDNELVPRLVVNVLTRGNDPDTPLPVCETCVHIINNQRAKSGMELVPIEDGAYIPPELLDQYSEDDFL